MIAAYFNHAINLIVSILMVPVLLKFLDLSEYILWAIFTTFGGATLQIENSIQVLSVRAISREYHSGNQAAMQDAIRRARRAYSALSFVVLVPVAISGFVYFSTVAGGTISYHWRVEWIVFACAYALNYYFGANNSILLALGKISVFNLLGSLTRLLNFVLTVLLLIAGFSVIGICVSFAVSVATGCALMAIRARNALRECSRTPPINRSEENVSTTPRVQNLVRYTVFTFTAFALYKGGVLLAAGFFAKEHVGSYSLIIQALTLLTAVALVPIQVWLSRLVKAILAGNAEAVMAEMGRTLIVVNMMFVFGTAVLLITGNRLLEAMGSSVMLPESGELLLVSCAFLVELNILVLINFLVTKQWYNFVSTYVICVAFGVGLAVVGILMGQTLYLSLVALPMAIQVFVNLPLMIRHVCTQLNTTPARFFTGLWQNVLVRN